MIDNFTKKIFMKKLSPFILFLVLGLSSSAFAQNMQNNFDQGRKFYQQEDYQKAANIFEKINNPEGKLFAGKSYFALGQYVKARIFLQQVDESAPNAILWESQYTLGLTNFQLKNFGASLDLLFLVKQDASSNIQQNAQTLYNQILSYLTIAQRKDAFQQVHNEQVRLDLIKAAFKQVDFETAKTLLKIYKQTRTTEQYQMQVSALETQISDSVRYKNNLNRSPYPTAPTGISYNIGVALPHFNPDQREYQVSRNLYNGVTMAAEEFNRRNPDKKIFLRYQNTLSGEKSVGFVVNNFAWSQPVDAIIGPLYSQSAAEMVGLSEQYQIPLIAPLANSDSLNIDNPYLYQANPTFKVRGKNMAEYAVNVLGFDTLGVVAQKNTNGSTAAYAFRDEAEKLGAKVVYFFDENFEKSAYDISGITKYFTADRQMRDSLHIKRVDAVYTPFTGQAASTLVDLFLTDLEASRSNITVLGSEKWGLEDLDRKLSGNLNIYYPESNYINNGIQGFSQFNDEYKSRFGSEPDRFSYIGYDTANFLFQTLQRVQNPALLKAELKNAPRYTGISGPINFKGSHINQEVRIFKLKTNP